MISGLVMFVLLGFGLLPALLYMTVKLTKFLWQDEKIIPLMLIALSTTTLSLTLYYLWIVCIYQWPEWMCLTPNDTRYTNVHSYVISNVLLPNFPALFLALAVILNVDKWIYFELRILAFIRVGKKAVDEMTERESRIVRTSQRLDQTTPSSNQQRSLVQRSSSADNATSGMPETFEYADMEQPLDGSSHGSHVSDPAMMMELELAVMKKSMKVTHLILAVIAIAYVSIFIVYTTIAIMKDDLGYLSQINTACSYMFCLLGTVFFTVGVIMNVSLARHFPDFYKQYSCLLWTATILLTVPLYIRTAKDYAYWHIPQFRLWFDSHFSLVNTVYAVLSLVFPIVT